VLILTETDTLRALAHNPHLHQIVVMNRRRETPVEPVESAEEATMGPTWSRV
jgi:hypothetical protein